MRLSELKGVVANLAEMACSWRIASDFEALAELPDGEVTFDLIQASATHSAVGELSLGAARELASWLQARLSVLDFDSSRLESAQVVLLVDTSSPPANRKTIVPYRFHCTADIAVEGRRYRAGADNFIWYNRAPNKPMQTDDSSGSR